MSVLLEIPDGNPWWLSPNIWTVPGNDPTGPAGLPEVGQSTYLFARVTNNGNDGVTDATVRFYWANPAVGFDRNTANLVGISNVSLNPGETKDVLCQTPWIPTFANNGHECILVEAFHEFLDPLPNTSVLNVPIDRHVAQRNLSVVKVRRIKGSRSPKMPKEKFRFAFEIHNKDRIKHYFTVEAAQGKLGQIETLIPFLGHDFELPKEEGKVEDLGFVVNSFSNSDDPGRVDEIVKLEIGPKECKDGLLVGTLDSGVSVIHIVQRSCEREIGGLSILIIGEEEKLA